MRFVENTKSGVHIIRSAPSGRFIPKSAVGHKITPKCRTEFFLCASPAGWRELGAYLVVRLCDSAPESLFLGYRICAQREQNRSPNQYTDSGAEHEASSSKAVLLTTLACPSASNHPQDRQGSPRRFHHG